MKDEEKEKGLKPKNTRVYDLARRLGISSKELIEELSKLGFDVKNHMSTLDPETVELVTAEIEELKKPAEELKKLAEDQVLEASASASASAKAVETEVEILPESKTSSGLEKLETTKSLAPAEAKSVRAEAEQKLALPEVEEDVTVSKLSDILNIKSSDLIKRLIKIGIIANINQKISYEVLEKISNELKFKPVRKPTLEERLFAEEPADPSTLKPRPPVVTIMGHVDHGKTSLLDAIRKTNLTEKEAGGITQHIGAYRVELETGDVVFLDTPGHEAFTAMRARGAQVTDIVVLVVASDDGVMLQTVEAINHAKAANVPILVAINKIDKPDAKPEVIKQQLSEYGLVPEEWGGQTIFVEVSAKTRIGIEKLLEMLLLEAELLELKANPDKPAHGTVIEAKLDKGRGSVATLLVQNGRLSVGDFFVCGLYNGKVRAMINDKGEYVKESTPSIPVEVSGFSGVPEAGDKFHVLDDKDAKLISLERQNEMRTKQLTRRAHITLDDLYKQIREGNIKELNIILKGDVQGSVEALAESLAGLSNKEVELNVIHKAVGGITETDVMLASASNAIVIGFNVRPTIQASKIAEGEKVDIRLYEVIYDIISDVKAAMEGLLEPELREVVIGRCEIRELFSVPKLGTIAGCYVLSGHATRGYPLRIIRDNRAIYQGHLDSLRRFKEDVRDVQSGYECGIGMVSFNDFKVGDILECYSIEKIARRLH